MFAAGQVLFGIWAAVLATLVAFVYVQLINGQSRLSKLNSLNMLVVVVLLMTYAASIPEFFIYGRTELECWLIQRWSGTFYFVVMGSVKFYFVKRSNQIVAPTYRQKVIGNALIWIVISATIGIVIAFQITLNITLIGPERFCFTLPDPIVALTALVINFVTEIAINVRFVTAILKSTKATRTATNLEHSRAPFRLLKLTCVISCSVMIVNIVVAFVLFNIVPITDYTWNSTIYMIDVSISACAVAWPAIVIRILKVLRTMSQGPSLKPSASQTVNKKVSMSKKQQHVPPYSTTTPSSP